LGLLQELPPPPAGRTGWPWDVEYVAPAQASALPPLAIVTPSYNQARFLEETIRSVLLQNYPALEYIVIDGGSADDSGQIINKYRPWLTHAVSEPDRGQAHALNKGFARATAALRGYINSDDAYLPGGFHAVAMALPGRAPRALVAGACRIVNEQGEPLATQEGSVGSFAELADLWGVWNRGGYLAQPAVFWRLEGAPAVEFREDLHYVMDYEFWGQCLLLGAAVIRVDATIGAFRTYQGQKSENQSATMREAIPVLNAWLDAGHVAEPRRTMIRADLKYFRSKQDVRGADRIGTLLHRAAIGLRVLGDPRTWTSRELARDLRRVLAVRRRVRSAMAFLGMRRLEARFRDIAARGAWGGHESLSGPGSSLSQTRVLREAIPSLLSELECNVMLDAPCGDFHWLSHVALPAKYLGCDIVPELIDRNIRNYASDEVEFFRADITKDPLPMADLVLCRDCLVHLPNRDIHRVLENFSRSGSSYLLTTTFPNRMRNDDIAAGAWRPLNLELPPFNLPPPIRLINEECTEFDGAYKDKSLGLWDLRSL
jgi:glycosyltransferase involved in cell wall biosynthesis/SAM-dependent methyltransferase